MVSDDADWNDPGRLPGDQLAVSTNTLTLSGPTVVVGGATYTWTLDGPTLDDGDQVNLGWGGTHAVLAGPCPFRGLLPQTLCMDIASPAGPFGAAIVSGTSATFTRTARDAPLGQVHLQAISIDGFDSATSNVLTVDLLRSAEDDDADGLDNGDEAVLGTDPLEADTDGDGVSDADEVNAGSDPLVAEPCGLSEAPGASRCVFTYTGDNQLFHVPEGVTTLTVTLWGAGGGGSDRGSSAGGGGAYVHGVIGGVVPSTHLEIVVGGGGSGENLGISTGGFGGGGDGNIDANAHGAAGGGGFSGVFEGTVTQTNALMIAGGGGGGTDDPARGGSGGPAGSDSTNLGRGGAGATQSAGGAGGNASVPSGEDGAALQGGAGGGAGAGGGGGYFGGGGGATSGPGGGGGGSSFVEPTRVTGVTTLSGSSAGVQSGHPLYIAGVGTSSDGADGGPGLVVIEW